MSSNKLTIVLEQISKSNLTLSDLEIAVGLFEKVTAILIEEKCPVSSLCSTKTIAQNSDECVLQSQLNRLRTTSIHLLNCRKIFPKIRSCGNKRSLPPDAASPPPKLPRKCKNESSLAAIRKSDEKVTDGGMGLLNICYICKREDMANVPRHEFYPWMCLGCGEMNFHKRNQSADLNGKVALVTGGRIKIGFEITLKLLRCGATVVITTRFPNDARRRYSQQNDFPDWSNRLHIFTLDLRFIPHVDKFCEDFLNRFSRLDILIQNAAQTIRRPAVYYRSLIAGEKGESSSIANANYCNDTTLIESPPNQCATTGTSQLLIHPEDFKYSQNLQLSLLHFPANIVDDDGNQIDLRAKNSWTTRLEEVETEEMVEVTLANYMSPFIILKKLTPLMAAGRSDDLRFVSTLIRRGWNS